MARRRTVYTKKTDFILTIGVSLYSKSDLKTKYPLQYFQYNGVKYEIENGVIINTAAADPIYKSINVSYNSQPLTIYHAFAISKITLGVKVYLNQQLTSPFVGQFTFTQDSIESIYTTNIEGTITGSTVRPPSIMHAVQFKNILDELENTYLWTSTNASIITIGTPVFGSVYLTSFPSFNKFIIGEYEYTLGNNSNIVISIKKIVTIIDPIYKAINVINNLNDQALTVYHAFEINEITIGVKIYLNQELTNPFVGAFKYTQNSIQRIYTTNTSGQITTTDIVVDSIMHEVQFRNILNELETGYIWTAPEVTDIQVGSYVYGNASMTIIPNFNKFIIGNNEYVLDSGNTVVEINDLLNPIFQKIICPITQFPQFTITTSSQNEYYSFVTERKFLLSFGQQYYLKISHIQAGGLATTVNDFSMFSDDVYVSFAKERETFTSQFILGNYYPYLVNFQVGDTLYSDAECSIPLLQGFKNFLDSNNLYYVGGDNDFIEIMIDNRKVQIYISNSKIKSISANFELQQITYPIIATDTLGYSIYGGPIAGVAYASSYGHSRFAGTLTYYSNNQYFYIDWYANGYYIYRQTAHPTDNYEFTMDGDYESDFREIDRMSKIVANYP
jgi:hypothetical protein